jgi:hypothetical protein
MSHLRTILKQYISEIQFFDTVEFFKDNEINNLHFIKTKIFPLKLIDNNLIGGNEYNLELKINNNEYQVYIDQYSDNFDKNKDKEMINYINNVLIIRLKKKNLVNDIINNIINDRTKEGCSILFNIYMKIYDKIGYRLYQYKHFELDLTKSKLIKQNK